MNKIAYIFPGQASQFVGMAKDLYDTSDDVKSLFESASRILDFDLAEICFDGPLDKLTKTEHTQPAVLVHSLAVLEMLGDDAPKPDFCAGHSLGEYSALACAGALTFEDAIAAVRDRSRLMKEACDSTDGTMTAAIGGDEAAANKIAEAAGDHGILQPANFNSPGQIALSGENEAIKFAQESYKEYGFKRMLPLKVGGAFHSPLMKRAEDGMPGSLEKIDFMNADIPVVANVTAKPVSDATDIKDLLVRQITSPVRWMQSVQEMYDLGVRTFVEIGPGKVLTGLVKKTVKDAEVVNVGTVEEIEEYLQSVRVG